MKAIVIATITGRCLPVMLASIKHYVPDDVVVYISAPKDSKFYSTGNQVTVWHENKGTNYGDSYNFVVHKAFQDFDEIIVANDDVVLTPDTYRLLNEDVQGLKTLGKLGWVAAKADYARPSTNQHIVGNALIHQGAVAPLFAYISKEAWIDYPPINWFSDDIQCFDMFNKGYRHYASRAYVHHVGSSTIGMDNTKNYEEPREWIKQNRPELYGRWYQ